MTPPTPTISDAELDAIEREYLGRTDGRSLLIIRLVRRLRSAPVPISIEPRRMACIRKVESEIDDLQTERVFDQKRHAELTELLEVLKGSATSPVPVPSEDAEAVETDYEKLAIAYRQLQVRNARNENELAEARAVVEKMKDYTMHHPDCEQMSTPVFDGDKRELVCDCGLSGVLAASRAKGVEKNL